MKKQDRSIRENGKFAGSVPKLVSPSSPIGGIDSPIMAMLPAVDEDSGQSSEAIYEKYLEAKAEEEKRSAIRRTGVTLSSQDFFCEYGFNSSVSFVSDFSKDISNGDPLAVQKFISHLSEPSVEALEILRNISFQAIGFIPDTGADWSGSRPGTIVEATDHRTGKQSILRVNGSSDVHDGIWCLIYGESVASRASGSIAAPVLLPQTERLKIETLLRECFPARYEKRKWENISKV